MLANHVNVSTTVYKDGWCLILHHVFIWFISKTSGRRLIYTMSKACRICSGPAQVKRPKTVSIIQSVFERQRGTYFLLGLISRLSRLGQTWTKDKKSSLLERHVSDLMSCGNGMLSHWLCLPPPFTLLVRKNMCTKRRRDIGQPRTHLEHTTAFNHVLWLMLLKSVIAVVVVVVQSFRICHQHLILVILIIMILSCVIMWQPITKTRQNLKKCPIPCFSVCWWVSSQDISV